MKYDLEPRITSNVFVGDTRRQSVILAGRLAEKGPGSLVYFDGSDNFVVLEVGKRGSGKSYGMASLLEGFATTDSSTISINKESRAVLLLDPLDIHWTLILPLSEKGPNILKRQCKVLASWPELQPEKINSKIWIPAGFHNDIDHAGFNEYYLPVSDLDADDWALLLKTDVILETRGRLISEAFQKVTFLGWKHSGRLNRPRQDYSIQDLIECISGDDEIADFYHPETIRSVIQPLRAYSRMPLFSARTGTHMTDLVKKGFISVLSLGRLGDDLRTVMATVIVRKLRQERMIASQIKRRLGLEIMEPLKQKKLEKELENRIPRTILAIDEAQILLPSHTNNSAKKALDSFVLEGRNYGLSLWLSTQRPKGAISAAAISQIDTFIVHRLSISDDIKSVCGLLQNAQPSKIRKGQRQIDLPDLIRDLDVGQALISSANSDAPRLVVAKIRPRMAAHGGDAF